MDSVVTGSRDVVDPEATRGNASQAWVAYRRAMLAVFLLAFVLRAVPNLWLEWREPAWHATHINEIEFYYDDVARSLIAGQGFVHSVNPRPSSSFGFNPGTPFHFVPPLYAWLLAVEYFIFGPNLLVAKLIQGALDSVVCILIGRIGIAMFDRRTALLAATFYAIYPLAIVMGITLYYQTLLTLALCWMVLCLSASITAANGAWTGIAVGLSALAKPVTLPLILGIPVVRMIERWESGAAVRPYLRWSAAFLLACIVTLAPWTARNYAVFHRFIPVQSGAGSPLLQGSKEAYIDLDVDSLRRVYGANFGVAPAQFTATAVSNHRTHLIEDPVDYCRFLLKKFGLAWYNTEGKSKNLSVLAVQLPFLALAVGGLAVSFRKWIQVPHRYVIGLIIFIVAIQIVFFPLVRYTLAVMPLVMLPAAFAVSEALSRFGIARELELVS